MNVRHIEGPTIMLKQIAIAVLAMLLAPASVQAQTATQQTGPYDRGLETRGYEHDGEARFVGVYEPSTYHGGQPAPLIVALHGRFSSPQALHAISGLAAVAEERGAIVIYPEALDGVRRWRPYAAQSTGCAIG